MRPKTSAKTTELALARVGQRPMPATAVLTQCRCDRGLTHHGTPPTPEVTAGPPAFVWHQVCPTASRAVVGLVGLSAAAQPESRSHLRDAGSNNGHLTPLLKQPATAPLW